MLERRDLFAAFLDPATANLVVIGTNAPETISVTTQRFAGFTQTRVHENGLLTFATNMTVNQVMVWSHGGNDDVSIGFGVPKAIVNGGAGNDVLRGGGYDDVLIGDLGNDRMIGGAGADRMIGGPGADTADYAGRPENLRITLDDLPNDGTEAPNGAPLEFDNVQTDVENVTGGNGHDIILAASAQNVPHWFIGNGGNDMLDGGALGDLLEGGAGTDRLFGNGGNDAMRGGLDDDALVGGAGSDLMFGDAGNDRFFSQDGGFDQCIGGAGLDLFVTFDAMDALVQ
jgi:Ca2+-binding RTX toxin-like protein